MVDKDKSLATTDQMSLAIPMMDIEELRKLTAYVADVKKTLMIAGKDYVIDGNRQYTARSGFAKLHQGFFLSDGKAEVKTLYYDEPHEFEYTHYIYKKPRHEKITTKIYGFEAYVTVKNVDTGRHASGEGACTVEELHQTNNMSPKWYHRCLGTAKTRAWNRAVSNFVGSADVSAEEMGLVYDMEEPERPERKPVESEQREVKPGGIPVFRSGAGGVVATIGVEGVKEYLITSVQSDKFNVDDFEVSEINGSFLIKNKKYIDYWHDVNDVIKGLGGEWIIDERDKKKNHWWLPKAYEGKKKATPAPAKLVESSSAGGVSSIEELEEVLGRRVMGLDDLVTVTQDRQGFTVEPDRALDSEIEEVINYVVEGLGGKRREVKGGQGYEWVLPVRQG